VGGRRGCVYSVLRIYYLALDRVPCSVDKVLENRFEENERRRQRPAYLQHAFRMQCACTLVAIFSYSSFLLFILGTRHSIGQGMAACTRPSVGLGIALG
jgi:hypothetical protein